MNDRRRTIESMWRVLFGRRIRWSLLVWVGESNDSCAKNETKKRRKRRERTVWTVDAAERFTLRTSRIELVLKSRQLRIGRSVGGTHEWIFHRLRRRRLLRRWIRGGCRTRYSGCACSQNESLAAPKPNSPLLASSLRRKRWMKVKTKSGNRATGEERESISLKTIKWFWKSGNACATCAWSNSKSDRFNHQF